MISLISLIVFIFTVTEAFLEKRPVLRYLRASTRLDLKLINPPIEHGFSITPKIFICN